VSPYALFTDEGLATAEELCCEVANETGCMRVRGIMASRIRSMREEAKLRMKYAHLDYLDRACRA
jgi:hypothetical protein